MADLIATIEPRQRINLSEEARVTIESDLLDYEGEKPKYNSAVNRIFLASYRSGLIKHDREIAAKYASRKPSSFSKKVLYLQTAVTRILQLEIDFINTIYCGSPGKYIKSVIEQYADLPYLERERIFFDEIVKQIETAILHKERITVESGTALRSVRPYRIGTDRLSAYNYLVGYIKQSKSKDTIGVFRVSRIKSVINEGEAGGLTDFEILELKKAIEERDLPYIIYQPKKILIRLNPTGLWMYSSLIQNRPIYYSKEDGLFTFYCSEAQAENYFFKFGANAEIIEPASLRDKFKDMYHDASALYDK